MQYLILYVLLLLFVIPGLKFDTGKSGNVLAVQKNINSLRGLFAILVVITHCTLEYESLPLLLFPFRKFSTFIVGFFFIMSGYGLAYSCYNKQDYLKSFLIRKLPPIAISAVISRIISEIFIYIFLDIPFSVRAILQDMNWFIYALIFLYVLFYIVYKLVKNRTARVLLISGVVVIVTFIILSLTQKGTPGIARSYYISEWAFPFGIAIFEFREEIDRLMLNHRFLVFALMLLLLGLTFPLSLIVPDYTALDLISHNMMLVPFYYILFVICRHFIFDSFILRFLGKISFEIFLYQFMFLIVLREYLKPENIIYFFIMIILTVATAAIVNFVKSALFRKAKI